MQQALNGATDVLEELPQAVQRVRYAVTSWERDGKGPLKQVQKTADELQKLAGASPRPSDAPVAAPRRRAEPKKLVVAGTVGMAIFVGQLVSVLFLTYFLLAAGDLFRRRLMQVMGPSLSRRKKALQILHQVHALSQRYFALVLAMNIAVGIVTAAGFVPARRPPSGVLGHRDGHPAHHSLPRRGDRYRGGGPDRLPAVRERDPALVAAAVPARRGGADRHLAADRADGRTARMNAVVVFVALLFFGMVWGGWGLLLAFPIMATVKIVFGEIERLKPWRC